MNILIEAYKRLGLKHKPGPMATYWEQAVDAAQGESMDKEPDLGTGARSMSQPDSLPSLLRKQAM